MYIYTHALDHTDKGNWDQPPLKSKARYCSGLAGMGLSLRPGEICRWRDL